MTIGEYAELRKTRIDEADMLERLFMVNLGEAMIRDLLDMRVMAFKNVVDFASRRMALGICVEKWIDRFLCEVKA